MINLKSIDYKLLKDKLQVKKPWDHVIIFALNFLITIPIFIILHQNIVDPNWYFSLDRILLFLAILAFNQVVLRALRTILIVCIFLYLIALVYGSIFGNYGFSTVAENYRSMMYSMAEDPNPQDIFISKLLPFPNKNKILESINFDNPRVRNFALSATVKNFRDTKGFYQFRTKIQCLAVFKEINDG
jgi:hypothetical protein